MSSKPICGATNRQGGECQLPAGWGTDHAGSRAEPGHGRCKLHGGASPNGRTFAAREAAAAEISRLGMPVDTEPGEALLFVVALDAGEVKFLQHRLERLQQDDGAEAKDLSPVARAYSIARDNLARHSKLALDAGIDERRLRIFEGTVERVATVLRLIVDELELTGEQEARLRVAMQRHLPELNALDERPVLELAA